MTYIHLIVLYSFTLFFTENLYASSISQIGIEISENSRILEKNGNKETLIFPVNEVGTAFEAEKIEDAISVLKRFCQPLVTGKRHPRIENINYFWGLSEKSYKTFDHFVKKQLLADKKLSAQELTELAVIYEIWGKIEESIELYENALKIESGNIVAKLRLSALLFPIDTQKATELFSQIPGEEKYFVVIMSLYIQKHTQFIKKSNATFDFPTSPTIIRPLLELTEIAIKSEASTDVLKFIFNSKNYTGLPKGWNRLNWVLRKLIKKTRNESIAPKNDIEWLKDYERFLSCFLEIDEMTNTAFDALYDLYTLKQSPKKDLINYAKQALISKSTNNKTDIIRLDMRTQLNFSDRLRAILGFSSYWGDIRGPKLKNYLLEYALEDKGYEDIFSFLKNECKDKFLIEQELVTLKGLAYSTTENFLAEARKFIDQAPKEFHHELIFSLLQKINSERSYNFDLSEAAFYLTKRENLTDKNRFSDTQFVYVWIGQLLKKKSTKQLNYFFETVFSSPDNLSKDATRNIKLMISVGANISPYTMDMLIPHIPPYEKSNKDYLLYVPYNNDKRHFEKSFTHSAISATVTNIDQLLLKHQVCQNLSQFTFYFGLTEYGEGINLLCKIYEKCKKSDDYKAELVKNLSNVEIPTFGTEFILATINAKNKENISEFLDKHLEEFKGLSLKKQKKFATALNQLLCSEFSPDETTINISKFEKYIHQLKK